MNQTEFQKLANKCKNIYDSGCYFLSLIYIGLGFEEPTLQCILNLYDTFVEKGWMDADCYVKNPSEMIKFITKRSYKVTMTKSIPKDAKYVVGYWFNKSTGFHHFVVMNKENKVVWDPIPNSNTVKNGVIESYRILS